MFALCTSMISLHFDYKPLVAIIGDIKSSKQLENRRSVQARFKEVLDSINNEYRDDIASKFMITLGDEFQGLLKNGSAAVFIIDKIEREMYPIKFRFGLGVGEITTDINSNMPLGADGPAYISQLFWRQPPRKGISFMTLTGAGVSMILSGRRMTT